MLLWGWAGEGVAGSKAVDWAATALKSEDDLDDD